MQESISQVLSDEIVRKIEDITKLIESLNLLELSFLVNKIKEKYGVEESFNFSSNSLQEKTEVLETSKNFSVRISGIPEEKKPLFFTIIKKFMSGNGKEMGILEVSKLVKDSLLDKDKFLIENVIADSANNFKREIRENFGTDLVILV